jgi:hypothetical protein
VSVLNLTLTAEDLQALDAAVEAEGSTRESVAVEALRAALSTRPARKSRRIKPAPEVGAEE